MAERRRWVAGAGSPQKQGGRENRGPAEAPREAGPGEGQGICGGAHGGHRTVGRRGSGHARVQKGHTEMRPREPGESRGWRGGLQPDIPCTRGPAVLGSARTVPGPQLGRQRPSLPHAPGGIGAHEAGGGHSPICSRRGPRVKTVVTLATQVGKPRPTREEGSGGSLPPRPPYGWAGVNHHCARPPMGTKDGHSVTPNLSPHPAEAARAAVCRQPVCRPAPRAHLGVQRRKRSPRGLKCEPARAPTAGS